MASLDPIRVGRATGTPVIVRSARPDDAPAILAISRSAALTPHTVVEPDEVAGVALDTAREIDDVTANPQRLWLVAEVDGRVVGELTFSAPRLRRIAHRGRLGLAVHADHRGQGVGKALIRSLLVWARRHPLIEKVRLGVLSSNTGAIRLYHRLGFHEEARRAAEFKIAPGIYADDILMARWVKPPPGNPPASTNDPS
ncbi:MAG: GNAT family N-acetyltransferase [Phycisphaeraceae bacterium]|nr:MAG: GNAT family N-acetyltransferase [Phycisphaeraceae bacterium]